jgi:membrane protein YdbS with pleckstrin-like domain
VKGQAVFTHRDRRFLFGHPREEVISAQLWLRFAVLRLTVVLVGLGIVVYVMPFSLASSLAAVLLAIVAILMITPKWMQRNRQEVCAMSHNSRQISASKK